MFHGDKRGLIFNLRLLYAMGHMLVLLILWQLAEFRQFKYNKLYIFLAI